MVDDSDLDAARRRIASAATLEELRAVENDLLGKKSAIAAMNTRLGELAPEARKERGREINELRSALTGAVAARRAVLEEGDRSAGIAADRIDLTEAVRVPGVGRAARRRGQLHLVTQTRDELEDVFIGMGFTVAEGPEVETDWYNFEALNIPPAHPARSGFDSLYLKLGEPGTVLIRPHTSPVQVRVMEAQRPPIYSIMPGRCYRKDTPDARHTPAFHQIEGLVIDRGITFGDLAGTIEEFTNAYFGPDIHSRLRPASFPFTEPSAEYEVTCVICHGTGCRTCSGTGWIELGGCGMVHPNVFEAVGIDPEEWSGFAFGFGIDRLAQIRHSISDMRVMADNDLRFATQF
ncbi:MAG: phenylalanyl-tRNA synthetase, alpha subunit [Acidimicrobiales bacterium]|jgi:phenylalanyl-tRNA synthetase alpha chain|nr:phenylalanyl-tRNA synthetase, alpha subunit [Acidimicrobiales bacterium]